MSPYTLQIYDNSSKLPNISAYFSIKTHEKVYVDGGNINKSSQSDELRLDFVCIRGLCQFSTSAAFQSYVARTVRMLSFDKVIVTTKSFLTAPVLSRMPSKADVGFMTFWTTSF